MNHMQEWIVTFIKNRVPTITAETLGWLAAVVLHAATIPTMLAVMAGLTDRLPSAEVILLLWGGLGLLYAKAVVQRDILNIVTIGTGFIVQACLMLLIFFK